MRRDPLSQILELIDARAIYAGGMAGGGAFAVRFPPPGKVKLFAIGRGRCLLQLDGTPEPFRLEAGDVFLLRRNAAFTIASDLAVPPIPAAEVFASTSRTIHPVGHPAGHPADSDDDFLFVGGHLDTDEAGGRLLTRSLPDFVHLSRESGAAGRLGALIAELVEEAASGAPGADIAASSLAHLLLIQVLRRYLTAGTSDAGWLRAACDPRLAPAMALMQHDPARAWSLPELARAAAMSRTAFATRFKAVAGIPPLAFLTEWRMRLAERALDVEGSSVARVAHAVGYGSEAAFSTAFKRVVGHAPRRGRRPAPETSPEPADATA